MSNPIPTPIPVRAPVQVDPVQQSVSSESKSESAGSLLPFITSISENIQVHEKVLLVSGQIGQRIHSPIDGTLIVNHNQDSFPATSWTVCDSYFKALIHLQPGQNTIRLDFVPTSPEGPPPVHSSSFSVSYLPLTSTPPLHLAIILGKDSPATFDAHPERIELEGNNLDVAIRKFRMAAYLWQAFTGEQMRRNGLGSRCWRYDEEWQKGTLTADDVKTGRMRNEARIHIIRSKKTVQQIQELNYAQQWEAATKKGELFDIAMEDVQEYFKAGSGEKVYVSCMFLDSHWDVKRQVIRGHAALGGGTGEVGLGIFGSQALHSYPSNLEEVQTAFSDTTITDTRHVANDCGESGSFWEAANIGIGAHLHETGHLFGCPHQEDGVMLRDYVRLNRSFTVSEPYSTRTKKDGRRVCLPAEECTWHRLDCLRFRFHPCFRLPGDPVPANEASIGIWGVADSKLLITATSGIAWLELVAEGDEFCHASIEYLDGKDACPTQLVLTEAELRAKLPRDKRDGKFKLDAFSVAGNQRGIDDVSSLLSDGHLELDNGRPAFKGGKLGSSQLDGTEPHQVLFATGKVMTGIRAYHGGSLDGVEFIYDDDSTQMFGKRGGKGSLFELDTSRGEVITGIYLRAGWWIDGVAILTSLGRKSEVFGDNDGGSGHDLIPPAGYKLAGIHGSCGPWVDGFGLVITQ